MTILIVSVERQTVMKCIKSIKPIFLGDVCTRTLRGKDIIFKPQLRQCFHQDSSWEGQERTLTAAYLCHVVNLPLTETLVIGESTKTGLGATGTDLRLQWLLCREYSKRKGRQRTLNPTTSWKGWSLLRLQLSVSLNPFLYVFGFSFGRDYQLSFQKPYSTKMNNQSKQNCYLPNL